MGVKAIELTGGGEPSLHPDFLALCDLITSNGMDLGVVTNGSIWTEMHPIVLSKALWVRFSLDAASADTYARTRHSSLKTYDKVRHAITTLVNRGPLVGVSFVVTHENWQELEIAADAAFEDGAANFRISAVFQNEGVDYFKEFEQPVREACARIKLKYEKSKFKIFDLFSDRLSDLSLGHPDYSFCGFQRASTYIGADYNVYRCCVLAYNSRGLLGSIKDKTFKQLWAEQDFSDFDARGCPRCMFNKKNRDIAYAISDNPLHVNFI